MVKGKIIPLVVTSFFVVVLSIFSFSLINASPSETDASQVPADGNEKAGNGDSEVINNVENQVNGSKADINNSIGNTIENSDNNQIENNITNNVEVNVDVNVTNNVDNNVKGQKSNAEKDNNNEDNKNEGKEEQTNDNNTTNKQNMKGTSTEEVAWGVDSASLTTSEMLSCVRENFGEPNIWGRYLGEKEGVSAGITPEEVELLHSNEIQILPIWNHFSDATGYENGKNEAEAAIQKAEELGIPEGVAIFADIEPSYPVDSEFIRGWYEVMNSSAYEAGIYGIFDAEKTLTAAFEEAAANDETVLDSVYIWTAAPNIGITPQSNAPSYQPEGPENALISGWQYGIDAKRCNIDTNLFDGNLSEVLW